MGDAIVLCDAGGGTVDLISYEIMKIDPLELKELAPSSGTKAFHFISPKHAKLMQGVLLAP